MPPLDPADITASFTALLRGLLTDSTTRGDALDAALKSLALQELRDLEPDVALLEALLAVPCAAWEGFEAEALFKWHTLLTGLLQLPEIAAAAPSAAAHASDELIDGAFVRAALPPADEDAPMQQAPSSLPGMVTIAGSSSGLAVSASVGARKSVGRSASREVNATGVTPGAAQATELAAVRALLHWLYRSGAVVLRVRLRAALGTSVAQLATLAFPPPGLRMLLEVLSAVIRGFGPAVPAHRALLRDVLVPLHRPVARLDETTPVLALYHEALVHCMLSLLTPQPALLHVALPPLLQAWPAPREGNSAKEILLLHELERLLEIAPAAQRGRVALSSASVLARCLASDNSRVAERALQIFASDAARAALVADYGGCVPLLLSSLLRGGVPHWNATVNKMTHEALTLLSRADPPGFAAAAKQCFGADDALSGSAAGAATPAGAGATTTSCLNTTVRPGTHAAPTMPSMRAPWATPLPRPTPAAAKARVGMMPRAAAGAGSGSGSGGVPPRSKGFDPYSRVPCKATPLSTTAARSRPAPGAGAPPGQFTLDFSAVSEAAALAQHDAVEPMETDGGGAMPPPRAPGGTHAVATEGSHSSADAPQTLDSTPPAAAAPAASAASAPCASATAAAAAAVAIGTSAAGEAIHPALDRVLAYMKRIEPSAEAMAANAPLPTYVREHLTAAPTLLPSVIFQDLVFGVRHAGPRTTPSLRAVTWRDCSSLAEARAPVSALLTPHTSPLIPPPMGSATSARAHSLRCATASTSDATARRRPGPSMRPRCSSASASRSSATSPPSDGRSLCCGSWPTLASPASSPPFAGRLTSTSYSSIRPPPPPSLCPLLPHTRVDALTTPFPACPLPTPTKSRTVHPAAALSAPARPPCHACRHRQVCGARRPARAYSPHGLARAAKRALPLRRGRLRADRGACDRLRVRRPQAREYPPHRLGPCQAHRLRGRSAFSGRSRPPRDPCAEGGGQRHPGEALANAPPARWTSHSPRAVTVLAR